MRRSLGTLLLTAALSSLGTGCGGAPHVAPVTPVEASDAPATEIAADKFATETAALLLSLNRDQEHKLLLAGAVQYQLKRAEGLFASGYDREAEDVVTGALLLLRHDDELISATRGRDRALLGAAHAAARSGDAGRAQALYELTLAITETPSIKSDVEDHLSALSSWNKSTQGDTALEQVGQKTRNSLARSVVDPRAELYLETSDDIIRWMRAALASSAGEGGINSREEREQAMEAYRAIRSGAPALIALNLRQGTPAAAVGTLEEADLERALSPGLRAVLEATATSNNPDAWMSLFRQLEDARTSGGGSETQLPKYVTDGAALWAAISLYRSAPGQLNGAMPLAGLLVEFGMPEVAFSILAQNTTDKTSLEELIWSLRLLVDGLLELQRTNQLDAARRSFAEATPLFERARLARVPSRGIARIHALMADLETRHGHVRRALPLMKTSVEIEAHPDILLRLAALQEQTGDPSGAKDSLSRAVNAAQKEGALLAEARAEEALYRIHRNTGDHELAAQALSRAYSRIFVLKKMAPEGSKLVATERLLAQILEYYGKERAVRSSYDRAIAAARENPIELEFTLTQMARAGLVTGDIELTRRATQQALDLGLPEENSVYIALWHQLNEKRLGKSADGLARQVLDGASRARGWIKSLREFGLGNLKAGDLGSQASGIVEKVEADFYALLDAKSAPSTAALKKIATSAGIDLIEVKVAQDLMAKKLGAPAPRFPKEAQLP